MQKSDLTDLEIETQDLKLRLARPGNAKQTVAAVPEIITQTQSVSERPPIAEKLPPEDGYIFLNLRWLVPSIVNHLQTMQPLFQLVTK